MAEAGSTDEKVWLDRLEQIKELRASYFAEARKQASAAVGSNEHRYWAGMANAAEVTLAIMEGRATYHFNKAGT